MLLSLIIPLYNVEPYVRRCLESCLRQDLPQEEYEFILIDDGSKDKSLEEALATLDGRGNVKTICQENSGQGVARNKGLAMAEGRYVWFVDSDDWLSENCFASLISRMEQDSLDILAVAGADAVGDTLLPRGSYSFEGVVSGREIIPSREFKLGTPFSIYRRSFLQEHALQFIGGVYHEDALFTPQAYFHATRVGACKDIIYKVFPNPTSSTRTVNPKRAQDYIAVILAGIDAFAQQQGCPREFDYLISSGFSNALKNCYRMTDEDVAALDRCAYEHRYLLEHLRRSSVLKFKIEGYVLSLFPRRMTAAYRFMELFNPHRPL